MKKDLKFYLKLFKATFALSAFTFGGGYMIVPLMRRKFVDQYHWIDDKEMIDMVAIAQSSPGAVAVNTSIIVGYRLDGIKGALVSVFGTVLPPLIILSIVSMFYASVRDNALIAAIMKGMQVGVGVIIVDLVVTMGMSVFQEKNNLSNIMMPTVFIAAYFFQVNVMFLIILCGSIALLYPFVQQKIKGGQQR
ncbi:MAG: chromate transporter [Erysipelotrichaceae bacterium]